MESTLSTAPKNPPTAHELAEAARLWGIEPSYWDMWGNQHHASPELTTAILGSLGVDASTQELLRAAVEERRWREWSRVIGPALVVTPAMREIAVSIGEAQASAEVQVEIRLEDGGVRTIQAALRKLAAVQEATLRGQRFLRKRIPVGDELPLGYHEASIQIGQDRSASTRLIVCPGRAYQPDWLESGRAAGLAISLYGVRSARNWGCGDTT